MTLPEIKASTKVYLTVEDVCNKDLLPITPRVFKRKLREGNAEYGFPISRIGKTILIPRIPFICYLEGSRKTEWTNPIGKEDEYGCN
jgi:hypothetical protein